LLDPVRRSDEHRAAMVPRGLGSPDGLVIGLLDGTKANARPFRELAEQRPGQRGKIDEVVHASNPAPSRIAPGDVPDLLAARCHAIAVFPAPRSLSSGTRSAVSAAPGSSSTPTRRPSWSRHCCSVGQ